jgi:hypothetical protein
LLLVTSLHSLFGLSVYYDGSRNSPLVAVFEPTIWTELNISLEYQESTSEFTIEVNDGADGIWGPFEYPFVSSSVQTTELPADGRMAGRGNVTIVDWSLQRVCGGGDFDANGILDEFDLQQLTVEIAMQSNDLRFDLDGDELVDNTDRDVWIHDVKLTFFGDANLDGEFNSTDLVAVYMENEYEDAIDLNSTWGTGDFNGDGDFNSRDLVLAFADGGYEVGPRAAAVQVPEPSTIASFILALILITSWQRRRA